MKLQRLTWIVVTRVLESMLLWDSMGVVRWLLKVLVTAGLLLSK